MEENKAINLSFELKVTTENLHNEISHIQRSCMDY